MIFFDNLFHNFSFLSKKLCGNGSTRVKSQKIHDALRGSMLHFAAHRAASDVLFHYFRNNGERSEHGRHLGPIPVKTQEHPWLVPAALLLLGFPQNKGNVLARESARNVTREDERRRTRRGNVTLRDVIRWRCDTWRVRAQSLPSRRLLFRPFTLRQKDQEPHPFLLAGRHGFFRGWHLTRLHRAGRGGTFQNRDDLLFARGDPLVVRGGGADGWPAGTKELSYEK